MEPIPVTEEQQQELERLFEQVIERCGPDKTIRDMRSFMVRGPNNTAGYGVPPKPKRFKWVRTIIIVALPTLLAIGSSVYLLYLSWGIRTALFEAVNLLQQILIKLP